ncbi:hypothetical protein SAMN05216357_112104 [Porphyromonadaceae bacterium KH3CP3RA]|nr:hypothetical protein SAMN05216357_112104 [Porphyromonadaceae bacterium KH3CP3RA]
MERDRNSQKSIEGDISFLNEMKRMLRDRNYEHLKIMIRDWKDELQELMEDYETVEIPGDE